MLTNFVGCNKLSSHMRWLWILMCIDYLISNNKYIEFFADQFYGFILVGSTLTLYLKKTPTHTDTHPHNGDYIIIFQKLPGVWWLKDSSLGVMGREVQKVVKERRARDWYASVL